MQRPRKSASVVYLTSVSLTPNSTLSCGSVRATPCNLVSPIGRWGIRYAHLQPQVVGHPTATAKSKKLPLVAAHAHILQGFVDNLGLACGRSVLFPREDYRR